jgi:hypothetical protein
MPDLPGEIPAIAALRRVAVERSRPVAGVTWRVTS